MLKINEMTMMMVVDTRPILEEYFLEGETQRNQSRTILKEFVVFAYP